MSGRIDREWDRLTGSSERNLAERIDRMSAEGLSAIQIASRLNLRVSVVWKHLHGEASGASEENQS